ncbi:type II toxin-antitoxin system RatA family toxin [Bartonella sp. DGB1]|uniref:type II toxin-antitoxin system RatA family toxin n=1 Tax=Bartonella sp. DGB1 TaxID=3239807 RepID=UPI0035239892
MSKFHTTHLVRHKSEQMFNLVADVEKYPEFLPMCKKLIITDSYTEDDKVFLVADMTVNYKGFEETFTSQVTLDKINHLINVEYIDGPFKYLHNYWSFKDDNDINTCQVEFFIEYEFKNKLLNFALSGIFDKIFKNFSEVFEQRADFLYGIK